MFVWYGDHNFGTIDLKRTMGTLSVTADPPAPFIFIRGPEWSVSLTNSSGLTQPVPTDQYTVESRYAHWGHADDVTVFTGTTAAWRIAPQLGAVQLSCNQSDASFQLLTLDGQQEEAGGFPAFIKELPEGNYKLTSRHHGNQHEQTLAIKAGVTNDNPIEFLYGAAMLRTEPPDASVQGGNGSVWGITPLNLPEIIPGTLQFTLHRAGYEPVAVTLEISANQTNIYQTNLISTGYTGGMKSAREYMAVSDYDKALEEVNNALLAKPDDADAIILRNEATGRGYIQRAKVSGKSGYYIEGGKELSLALQSLPDNEEAKLLVADFKQHEPEEIERIRIEHLNSGTNTFNAFVQGESDEELFDSHILKTTMPVKDVKAAILNALRIQPAFQVTSDNSPTPYTFEIGAVQKLSTYLATSAGRRQCFIVGAQTRPDETQIIYKVLEYKTEAQIKFSIGNLIGAPGAVNYIPVSPARIPKMTDKLIAQLQYGVSNLTVRIQGAIGQTPTLPLQPAVSQ
jgi:hypothetical protein